MNHTLALLLVALVSLGAVATDAYADPFLPPNDAQVLERLPYKASDPAMAELRAEGSQLRAQPDNLRLAVRIARRYVELGRVNGDPRYAGYAQAALMNWWNLARPPHDVLLLRATLRQRAHDFDGSLADLNTLLQANPFDAQARLTRATVLQVQGHYAAARNDCQLLQRVTDELVATVCLTNVDSFTGHLRESYEQLRFALEHYPTADPAVRSWVLTALAEMAVRVGKRLAAESYFRRALELDPDDFYLLGAYSDFLLDGQRPGEVLRLLANKTSADPLLLRYVLALEAERSPQLQAAQQQLQERFAASHLRGDRVHLREEARFALHVLHDAPRALQLAKENWKVQKEPADLRILYEAAQASRDRPTLTLIDDWMRSIAAEDYKLTTTDR